MSFKDRISLCKKYMKESSLFLFHKQTRCRKKLIVMTLGDSRKPLFNTVDKLLDFYTQQIPKHQRARFKWFNDSRSASSSEKELSNHDTETSQDEALYQAKTVNDRFLEDPNSSAYIEEVLTAQNCLNFSETNLREQASTIK